MKKLVVIWHYAHGSCLETWMVKSTKSIVKLPVVNWYHASPFWPNSWMLDALPMTWRSNLPSLGTTTSQHISTVQAKPHGHCQRDKQTVKISEISPQKWCSADLSCWERRSDGLPLPRDPEAGGPLKTVLLPHQNARRVMEKCGEGLDKERSRPWLDPDQIHSVIMIRIDTVKDV